MSGKLAYDGRGVEQALAERYWRLLGLSPGHPALDVGCGTGKLGAAAPSGIEVHGVDMGRSRAETARAPAHATAVRTLLGGARHPLLNRGQRP